MAIKIFFHLRKKKITTLIVPYDTNVTLIHYAGRKILNRFLRANICEHQLHLPRFLLQLYLSSQELFFLLYQNEVDPGAYTSLMTLSSHPILSPIFSATATVWPPWKIPDQELSKTAKDSSGYTSLNVPLRTSSFIAS